MSVIADPRNPHLMHLTYLLQSRGFSNEGAAEVVTGRIPTSDADQMRLLIFAKQDSNSVGEDLASVAWLVLAESEAGSIQDLAAYAQKAHFINSLKKSLRSAPSGATTNIADIRGYAGVPSAGQERRLQSVSGLHRAVFDPPRLRPRV